MLFVKTSKLFKGKKEKILNFEIWILNFDIGVLIEILKRLGDNCKLEKFKNCSLRACHLTHSSPPTPFSLIFLDLSHTDSLSSLIKEMAHGRSPLLAGPWPACASVVRQVNPKTQDPGPVAS